jgi:hypothetical protein
MAHIYYNNNLITGENSYSKLSLVDLAGSESSAMDNDSGERVTDLLHVMKTLSGYVSLLLIRVLSIAFVYSYSSIDECFSF